MNRTYDNYNHQQAEFQTYSLFSSILKAGVSVFSRRGVPIFLMISGVLLLNKRFDEPHSLKRFYRYNVLRLLLTTEIWYLIMFWFIVLFNPTNTTLETNGTLGTLDQMFQNQLTLGAGGTFLLCCAYQLYAYSKPQNYLVSCCFPGILICAVFLFELFRRFSERLRLLRSWITCLSKISFGIYFVHIVIMESLNWYADWSLRPAVRMAVLEIVSFGGSILMIWLLAKIPVCKKYLFMIKD